MAEYWFKPKERGIGAGVPINWKGWTLYGAYVASILAVPQMMRLWLGYEGSVYVRLLAVVAISIPFLIAAWKKTEGGWRWRRGETDADDEGRA